MPAKIKPLVKKCLACDRTHRITFTEGAGIEGWPWGGVCHNSGMVIYLNPDTRRGEMPGRYYVPGIQEHGYRLDLGCSPECEHYAKAG